MRSAISRPARRRAAVWTIFAVAAALVLAVWLPAFGAARAAEDSRVVYTASIEGTIDAGMEGYVKRVVRQAQENGASLLVFEINTLGGRLDSAEQIGQSIRASQVPTVAYVRSTATSAGSYIALNAGKLIMQPGSSIGAAAVVTADGRPVTDAKVVSHWASQMRAAAELRGRDPRIAEAMVRSELELELPAIGKTVKSGEILSLSAEEALKVGYADGMAGSLSDVLKMEGFESAHQETVRLSLAERLASFLTNPVVMTLLFIVGIAGVAIELIVPGFGVPGVLGICGFGLYFFGQYAAGAAGYEHVLLFVLGIALLTAEMFVPSFGLLGVAGVASLGAGIVLAARDTAHALVSLGFGSAVAVGIVIIFAIAFRDRGIWNRFILRDRLSSEEGYVASEDRRHLQGMTGKALTPLRPSGTILIEGRQVDVVANGRFIGAGSTVKVIDTDGTRVVVEEVEPHPPGS
ncbi:nodulation protein NfeD [Paenibacillus thermoaerophilus]|uniref:Nodulation protein NfeD n=1 Tax=Paenibacillus thermoaerophilus TaxID=1215385 RepID=A0ABW2V1V1_9BACL|nr:nodulation protein NfeD [Paenibacillus thermoaerophilus]TMV19021.1 nodulation protein NfeD [Paenibacillus thermoaerophilus]